MDEAPASERGELWTRRDNFFSQATRDGEHTPRKKQKKPLEQAGFFWTIFTPWDVEFINILLIL